MGNSPLVVYTKISPNSSNPRNKPISKITIHHMAGSLTVEACGNIFAAANRQASSNYGIGSDGRVGMYVEEKNRAWTSSSPANDNRSITIEVANSEIGGDWKVSDKAFNTLIDLCVDICSRNGISELVYTGKPDGSLTHHQMFAATTCPGPYLLGKFPKICNLVNARLKKEEDAEVVTTIPIKINNTVKTVQTINKDGNNYVKLRDLESPQISVSYDAAAKMPVVKTIG